MLKTIISATFILLTCNTFASQKDNIKNERIETINNNTIYLIDQNQVQLQFNNLNKNPEEPKNGTTPKESQKPKEPQKPKEIKRPQNKKWQGNVETHQMQTVKKTNLQQLCNDDGTIANIQHFEQLMYETQKDRQSVRGILSQLQESMRYIKYGLCFIATTLIPVIVLLIITYKRSNSNDDDSSDSSTDSGNSLALATQQIANLTQAIAGSTILIQQIYAMLNSTVDRVTSIEIQVIGAGNVDYRLDVLEAQLTNAGNVDSRLDALESNNPEYMTFRVIYSPNFRSMEISHSLQAGQINRNTYSGQEIINAMNYTGCFRSMTDVSSGYTVYSSGPYIPCPPTSKIFEVSVKLSCITIEFLSLNSYNMPQFTNNIGQYQCP